MFRDCFSIGSHITFLVVMLSAVSASAQSQPPQNSGRLMLGVEVVEIPIGLQVVQVLPGSPAEGKLRAGDVLRFLTAQGHPIYSAQKVSHIERAKAVIGLNRDAALEMLRPTVGRVHFFVRFVVLDTETDGVTGRLENPGGPVTVRVQPVERPDDQRAIRQLFDGYPSPMAPGNSGEAKQLFDN